MGKQKSDRQHHVYKNFQRRETYDFVESFLLCLGKLLVVWTRSMIKATLHSKNKNTTLSQYVTVTIKKNGLTLQKYLSDSLVRAYGVVEHLDIFQYHRKGMLNSREAVAEIHQYWKQNNTNVKKNTCKSPT